LTTSDTYVIIAAEGGDTVPTKGSDRITVRFPEPLHSQLLSLAKRQETNPSEIIREATREFILKSNSEKKSEKP
jgi:metal-responsive CopG/Arc/MetJ family transcriptional regulator